MHNRVMLGMPSYLGKDGSMESVRVHAPDWAARQFLLST
jgi:hypothetical protein